MTEATAAEKKADEEAYERRANEANDRLRPLLTDEFLATLILAARTVGWSVDFYGVDSFIDEVFSIAGK